MTVMLISLKRGAQQCLKRMVQRYYQKIAEYDDTCDEVAPAAAAAECETAIRQWAN